MRSAKRIVYILIILLISSVSYAQDDVLDEIVDVSYEGISMEALLDSMYLKYAFNFSYDPSALPVDSVLNVNYSQHSLYSILQEVFKNYDLSFKSVGRQVIISHQKREVALSNYITLRGRVVSADNGQSIPLVNIAVMGESLGTSTNMDGEFVFLIPQHLAGAALHMSSIGYSSYNMAVPQRDTTMLVLLRSQSVQLKEIKVRFIRPREVIKRMVENRARNYFTSPMLLTAFFRESIRQDGKYIEVSEAVLDIYKSSYLKTSDREEARLVKGRKKVEDEDVFLARLKLAGGPALFSTIDVAKHLNFISEEEDDNYFYIHKGKGIVRDRVVYRVGFKPIVELDDIYYEGELCVDVETFALISADFSMTRKTLRKSDQYLIRKNAKRIKSVPVFTRYQVDYRPMVRNGY